MDHHGSKEEAQAKMIAGDGSPNLGAFNCSGQPNQYDCNRGHIGIGPVVLVRRQAIALTRGQQPIIWRRAPSTCRSDLTLLAPQPIA